MTPHLEILPAAQRVFWDTMAGKVPRHFVLYGGTAVALRCGHRESVDFDFFSDRPLDAAELTAALPALQSADVLQRAADTLIARIDVDASPVKLSFFGGLGFGRVGVPDDIPGRAAIASPLDLLATKLKTLHDRVEARDYLDIEALLRGGLTLNDGIAATMAMFGAAVNPLDTAKAVAWFKDGNLDRLLSASTRSYLERAAATFDPRVTPAKIRSRSLR